MRYIKTFESNEPTTFVVWDAKFVYAILKIVNPNIKKRTIDLERLFLYDFENDTATRSTDDSFEVTKDEFKNSVIYQSESLDEIFKILPKLKDSTNYNL